MRNKITIYTDGAARGNPGKAGWGSIIIIGDKIHEIGGRKDHGTNNQMELTAPIEALKYLENLPHPDPLLEEEEAEIDIFSDSKYVINGVNEWIHNWIKNGWRNAAKKPVLNKELWEELHELNQNFKPKWHYVAGHNGDRWNERADIVATSFADDEPVELRNK